MPNYVPCLTGQDQDAHLYAPGDPTKALCGKPVGGPMDAPGGRQVCVPCAKRFLARIFEHQGRINEVEVNVH
jgi:hypothetical protein